MCLSVLCVAAVPFRNGEPELDEDEDDLIAKPIHGVAIVLDLLSGITLLVITILALTNTISISKAGTYATLAVGVVQCAPHILHLLTWCLQRGETPG